MSFFKKSTAETASLPVPAKGSANPYLNGREEWLERYGSYISRAAQWRMVAFMCLLITGASIAGNVIQAQQMKIVPYVIEVDQLGKASAVARADIASPIPQRVVQAEIAACIVSWRTVTADLDLQKKMLERLSAFVTGNAKGVVRQWFEENNPYEKAKKGQLVQVNIKGLPLPVSVDSYRVEWTETTRSHMGVTLETKSYEATVSIQVIPPTTDDIVLKNPGGVYLTALSFATLHGVTHKQ